MRFYPSSKRTGLMAAIATLVLTVVLGAGIALAVSPHFVGKVTAAINSTTGVLTVSWKEAGLGNNQNINYTASAQATATYVCVNNGGQCPNAANKITVSGPVSASGTFSSDKNGNITASLTVNPPAATKPDGTAFTCPGGQTVTLSTVTYTNIKITDTTSQPNVTSNATPSTATATPFTCPGP